MINNGNIVSYEVLYENIEFSEKSQEILTDLSNDFVPSAHMTPPPKSLLELKNRAIRLDSTIQLAKSSQDYQGTWKMVRVVLGAALVVGVTFVYFSHKKDVLEHLEGINTEMVWKGINSLCFMSTLWLGYKILSSLDTKDMETVKAFTIFMEKCVPAILEFLGAQMHIFENHPTLKMFWYGYLAFASIDLSEVEMLKDFAGFLRRTFPTIAGILDGSNADANQREAAFKTGQFELEVRESKKYLQTHFELLDNKLTEQIGLYSNSSLPQIAEVVSQLQTAQEELRNAYEVLSPPIEVEGEEIVYEESVSPIIFLGESVFEEA